MQRHLTSQNLLIIDKLGVLPLGKSSADLFFEVMSQGYEHVPITSTSNLPFEERRKLIRQTQPQEWVRLD